MAADPNVTPNSGRGSHTLAFSAQTRVPSRNEIFPLERAPQAYERMMSGKARFRVDLTMK